MTIHANWKERLGIFALGLMFGIVISVNSGWLALR